MMMMMMTMIAVVVVVVVLFGDQDNNEKRLHSEIKSLHLTSEGTKSCQSFSCPPKQLVLKIRTSEA